MNNLKTLCVLALITAVAAGCGLNSPKVDETAPDVKMEQETGKAVELEESTTEEPVIEETETIEEEVETPKSLEDEQ